MLLLSTASGWHLVQSTHLGSIYFIEMGDSKVLSLLNPQLVTQALPHKMICLLLFLSITLCMLPQRS